MESKTRFQILIDDDVADMARRRNMKMDEIGLAVVLRGKSHRFGNPFYQADKYLSIEWNIPIKTLRRLRRLLQQKGVIKVNTHHGKGLATEYEMLDQVMIPKPSRLGTKPSRSVTFCPSSKPSRSVTSISNKKYKKKENFIPITHEQIRKDKEALFKRLDTDFTINGVLHRIVEKVGAK